MIYVDLYIKNKQPVWAVHVLDDLKDGGNFALVHSMTCYVVCVLYI